MPDTPRAIRIPDDLWQAALAKAAERGDTVSEVVRKALERYVKRSDGLVQVAALSAIDALRGES